MRQTVVQIRCSLEEKEQWKSLAEAKGTNLSDYLRSLLNAMLEKAR